MPQYTSGQTLEYMVARVLQAKPNASQSEVVNCLNSRIHTVIDGRIYWSDLLAQRIIPFPNAYTTGTVNLTQGSNVVTGAGTAWPTNDVVNTTSTAAVLYSGYQEITPASMNNIKIDTMLYCDSGGANPEVVSVVEVTPTTFWASFTYSHSTNFTLWSSSLSGQQLNTGDNNPIFDVWAISSSTTAILNQPFGGASVTSWPYQILVMLVTIDPLLKVILSVVDPQQGIPMKIYVRIEDLDAIDPQRSSQMNPLCLVQSTPTPAGTMRYEVYPTVTSVYQLRAIVGLQWPELKYDTDRSPWFIDPDLFVTGALADILRIKNCRIDSDKDPWHNPQLAMEYEQLFRLRLQDVINADEAKAQRAFSNMSSDMGILQYAGGNWFLAHDIDLTMQRF